MTASAHSFFSGTKIMHIMHEYKASIKQVKACLVIHYCLSPPLRVMQKNIKDSTYNPAGNSSPLSNTSNLLQFGQCSYKTTCLSWLLHFATSIPCHLSNRSDDCRVCPSLSLHGGDRASRRTKQTLVCQMIAPPLDHALYSKTCGLWE